MLRVRERIVSHLISPSSTTAISPLYRLLPAAAAAAASAAPTSRGFAVEEYLVDTCGLTRPQAIKASKKLSHGPTSSPPPSPTPSSPSSPAPMPPPSSPKTRGSFAPAWTRPWPPSSPGSPASVCRVLRSPASSRLPAAASEAGPSSPRCTITCLDNFLRALQRGSYLLCCDPEKVVELNVVFLRECGLGDCYIAKLCICQPRMLTTNPERVRAMVACAERLGVPRGSGMLRQALQTVAFLSEEKVTTKLEYLKNTFRWSDAEVSIAFRKFPSVLKNSKASLKRRSEFLFSKVGVEPLYIAHRPEILSYSMEGRLRPRCYVINFLKKNGLLDRDMSLYSAVKMTEKVFVGKLISPHKEAAPQLAKEKCQLISDLHERRRAMEIGYSLWHN